MSNIDKRPYRADGGDISTGRIKEIADNPYGDEEKCWLAKRVLASLDAEPVAWTDEQELRDVEKYGCGYLFTANPITPHADPRRVIKLYTTPPVPVVPEELLTTMEEVLRISDRDHEAWHKAKSAIAGCRATMLKTDRK